MSSASVYLACNKQHWIAERTNSIRNENFPLKNFSEFMGFPEPASQVGFSKNKEAKFHTCHEKGRSKSNLVFGAFSKASHGIVFPPLALEGYVRRRRDLFGSYDAFEMSLGRNLGFSNRLSGHPTCPSINCWLSLSLSWSRSYDEASPGSARWLFAEGSVGASPVFSPLRTLPSRSKL